MLFLSHSSKDKDRVRVLKTALEAEDFDVWLDEKEIAAGAHLAEILAHNIDEATGFVLVGSASAMQTPWVDREFNYAVEKGIPVIPVSWEDFEWPESYRFLLSGVVRVRIEDGKEAEAAQLIRKAFDDQITRVQGILKPNILVAPRHLNPATLLNARYRIVPFYDEPRASELEFLTNWCQPGGSGTSVRLFTGPGGSGKTRLFIEWAHRLREQGWMSAGFLREQATFEELRLLARAREAAFVIIDYAETRLQQLNDLLAMLVDRPASFLCLRVALLAREHGSWWDRLGTSARHLLESLEPWTLRPVSLEQDQRSLAFQMAYDTFTDGKGRRPDNLQLTDTRFERMLYIHMAALAAAQDRSLAAEGLLEETVLRETRFWFPEGTPPREFKRRASRLVAAVTLRGRTSRKALVTLDPHVQGPNDPEFRDLIADLYAPATEPAGKLVGGLQPDLLGEALIAQVLSDPETFEQFLEHTFDETDAEVLENGFVVLGRIGLWETDLITEWLPPFFNNDVLKRALPAMSAFLSLGKTTARKLGGSLLLKALQDFAEARTGLEGDPSSAEAATWAELVTVGYALSLVSASMRLTPPSVFGLLARHGHLAEAATLARMSGDAEGLALVALEVAPSEDQPLALELLREALQLFADAPHLPDETQSAVVDAVKRFGEQEDFQALFNQIGQPAALAFFLGDGAEIVEPKSYAQMLSDLVKFAPRKLASAALQAPPANVPKEILLNLADAVGKEESGYAAKALAEVAGALMRLNQRTEAVAIAQRALELGKRLAVSNWIAFVEAFDASEMTAERDRALEQALELLNECPETYTVRRIAGELARYWRARGHRERIDWLAQWIERREEPNRDFYSACKQIARWYAIQGQDELAFYWASETESDDTDGSLEQSAWSAAAKGFATTGHLKPAVEAAERSAGFGWKSAFGFAEVAAIIDTQGHHTKAETLARQSIAAATQDAIKGLENECWSRLATALAKGGRKTKARMVLSRAAGGKIWDQVRAHFALDQVDEAIRLAETYENPAVFEVLTEAVKTKMTKGDQGNAAILVETLARLTGCEALHVDLTQGDLTSVSVDALLCYCDARIALEPQAQSPIVERLKAVVTSTVAEIEAGGGSDDADPLAGLMGPDADERLAQLGLFLATHHEASTAKDIFERLNPQIEQIPDFDSTDDDYETGSDFLRLPDLVMRVGCGWHQLGDDKRALPILQKGLRILRAPKKSRDPFAVSYIPGVMQESVRCLAEINSDEEIALRLHHFSPGNLAYAARGLLDAQRPGLAARMAYTALSRAASGRELNKVHEVVGIIADVVLATFGVSAVAAIVDAMDRVVDWWS